ncbi:MAG: helix-turn-helix domain-containing protein [Bacteroidetes bacterium]|nr:helix-turn-helix domain-containing protein [Bacteroidota bacterium]
MDNLLSIRDAAKRLQLSPTTIRRLIKKGAIKAQKIGKQYRISQKTLDNLISPPNGN